MRLLWNEGREALVILLSVCSVRCALKGLHWVELEVGRGVGRRYYEQSMSMYFKVLSALWSISSSSKVMCWMVGWEKGESNAIFF